MVRPARLSTSRKARLPRRQGPAQLFGEPASSLSDVSHEAATPPLTSSWSGLGSTTAVCCVVLGRRDTGARPFDRADNDLFSLQAEALRLRYLCPALVAFSQLYCVAHCWTQRLPLSVTSGPTATPCHYAYASTFVFLIIPRADQRYRQRNRLSTHRSALSTARTDSRLVVDSADVRRAFTSNLSLPQKLITLPTSLLALLDETGRSTAVGCPTRGPASCGAGELSCFTPLASPGLYVADDGHRLAATPELRDQPQARTDQRSLSSSPVCVN